MATISTVDYQQDISMQCLCPADQLHDLQQQLRDAGRGQIIISTAE